MADVTEERSILIEAVDYEQSRQITNSGADDIEVSTDKFFRWGYGIRIGPGLTEPVVLHVRESLYAMCAPGESSTATLDGVPPDPAAGPVVFAHLTEDAENTQYLATDGWGFASGDPDGTNISMFDKFYAESPLGSDAVEESYFGDSGIPAFARHADGSLHWGDGTTAPPNRSITPLNRWEGDTGLVFDDTDGDGFIVGDPDADSLTMSIYGLYFSADGGDTAHSSYGPTGANVKGPLEAESVTISPGGVLQTQSPDSNVDRAFGVGNDGHVHFSGPGDRVNARGKGFKLQEADGTFRTITVAAGALVVT